MTSVASFDGLVCRDLVAGLFCFRHHAGKVVDNESRMRVEKDFVPARKARPDGLVGLRF
jgi:hypothetical protein